MSSTNAPLAHAVGKLGIAASSDEADLVAYSRDLWPRNLISVRAGRAATFPPQCIAWPKNVEEVARVIRFAHDSAIEVVPFGAGSGVCGAIAPTRESLVLDMKHMRAIATLDERNHLVSAESGILGQHLEDRLNERQLTLGHFPSSIYCSTLGGWLAARSAGQCSGRYGKIEDMVESFRFVDGRGRVRNVERGATNGDLHSLLIGSEGTLGVFTDATLRVSRMPTERVMTSFSFPATESGIEALRRTYQLGLRPAVARLYDAFDSWLFRMKSDKKSKPDARFEATPVEAFEPPMTSRALNLLLRKSSWLNGVLHAIPDRAYGGALAILLWEDDPRIARAELDELRRLATELGAKELGAGPAELWLKHRHSVGYRQSAMFAMGAFVDTMEISAPWSRIPELYERVREAMGQNVFIMAHFSHAYPDGGSIYFTFAASAETTEASEALYDKTWRDAMRVVLDHGGSLSHHHGIGRSKAPMLRREAGASVELSLAIKRELDPKNILNPGALFGDLK